MSSKQRITDSRSILLILTNELKPCKITLKLIKSHEQGFTVKAKTPPKKEGPEWDYAKIKDRMKGKTVVFCLPGRGCSFTFLKAFVQLCFDMVQNGSAFRLVKTIHQW